MRVDITDEELRSLTAAIFQRHGIDFTCYEPQSLKRRFIRSFSVFNISSVHDIWKKILNDPEFIHPFVNEITVGLTAMFRDPKLWVHLKGEVKRLLDSKEELLVWHAGCSSGEEVYTFNILLEEMKLRHRVKSIATDLNSDALKKASIGEYHYLKMIEYERNYKEFNPQGDFKNYYIKNDKSAQMDINLINNVRFIENNLLSDHLIQRFDIIFCRNVMIYFDNGAKRKVMSKFHVNLRNDGLLIIGYFDSLVPVIDKSLFDFYNLDYKIFKRKIPAQTVPVLSDRI